jgi:U3 small nucleolar RNA-associated protein 12
MRASHLIVSPRLDQVFKEGKWAVTAALENLCIWNLKQGALVKQLNDGANHAQVTCLCMAQDGKRVAAGYEDGRIRIWDLESHECAITLSGHKAAITCLQFNDSDSLLASGSSDTNIVIWDTVGEVGLYRLHGHKNKVTDCRFLTTQASQQSYLVTSSADTYVKVWDLETQHCVQTLTGHRGEVWSIDVNPTQTRLVTGSVDKLLRVWEIHQGGGTDEICTPLGEVRISSVCLMSVCLSV